MSIIDQNQDQDQITEIVLIDPNSDNAFDFVRKNHTEILPESLSRPPVRSKSRSWSHLIAVWKPNRMPQPAVS